MSLCERWENARASLRVRTWVCLRMSTAYVCDHALACMFKCEWVCLNVRLNMWKLTDICRRWRRPLTIDFSVSLHTNSMRKAVILGPVTQPSRPRDSTLTTCLQRPSLDYRAKVGPHTFQSTLEKEEGGRGGGDCLACVWGLQAVGLRGHKTHGCARAHTHTHTDDSDFAWAWRQSSCKSQLRSTIPSYKKGSGKCGSNSPPWCDVSTKKNISFAFRLSSDDLPSRVAIVNGLFLWWHNCWSGFGSVRH